MKTKYILIIVLAAIIVMFSILMAVGLIAQASGCLPEPDVQETSMPQVPVEIEPATITAAPAPAPPPAPESLDSIEINFVRQNVVVAGEQKVVMWITNNKGKAFVGRVTVYALDARGEIIDWDIISFDYLESSDLRQHAILWFKDPHDILGFKYIISGEFEDEDES